MGCVGIGRKSIEEEGALTYRRIQRPRRPRKRRAFQEKVGVGTQFLGKKRGGK